MNSNDHLEYCDLLFVKQEIESYDPSSGQKERSEILVPVTEDVENLTAEETVVELKVSYREYYIEKLEFSDETYDNTAFFEHLRKEINKISKKTIEYWEDRRQLSFELNEFRTEENGNDFPLPVIEANNGVAFTAVDWNDRLEQVDTFYDGIENSYIEDGVLLDKINVKVKNNEATTDGDPFICFLVKEVIKLAFQEPLIVRLFFSKFLQNEDSIDEAEFKKYWIEGKSILQTRERADAIIRKNAPKSGLSKMEKAKKTEGVFLYFDIDEYNKRLGPKPIETSEGLSSEDNLFTAYLPLAAMYDGTKIHADDIANRRVKFDFKFQLSEEQKNRVREYSERNELGWINPDAINLERDGKLADNKLLAHWVGDSLGVSTPFQYQDDYDDLTEEELDSEIAAWMKDHLYSKEVSLPDNQLPLVEEYSYRFGFIPMYPHGGLPINPGAEGLNEYLQKWLGENQNQQEEPFKVDDPLGAVELIPYNNLSDCTPESNTSQIVLQHPFKKEREEELGVRLLVLPPRVDFNIAKWQGLFIHERDTIYSWVGKLDKPVPERGVWIQNSIPYVFDRRAVDADIIVRLKDYWDGTLLSGTVASFSLKGKDSLNDATPVRLDIVSVPSRGDSIVKVQPNGSIKCHVQEGRQVVLELAMEYKNGEDWVEVIRETKIINAVWDVDFERDTAVRKPFLDVTNYQRNNISEGGEELNLSFDVSKLNYAVTGYYYLFRRYMSVDPNANADVPELKQVKRNRRKQLEYIDANRETDESLFEDPHVIINDTDEEESTVDTANCDQEVLTTISRNKEQILHIDNIFSLKEVFGETRAELLRSYEIDPSDSESQPRESKVYFKSQKEVKSYTFKGSYKDSLRAKNIDYLNGKFYSKHLGHFKEKRVACSLYKLDSNLQNKEFGKSQLQIDHGFGEKDGFIKMDPPEFELQLLYLYKDEKNTTTRTSLLLISFDRSELNVISDDEYIGIDFGKTEKDVGGVAIKSFNTDLGVDFTMEVDRDGYVVDNPLDRCHFVSPIGIKPPSKKTRRHRLDTNWNGASAYFEMHDDKDFRYMKPLYSYNQDQGFILLNISGLMTEDNLDPFLKLTLCRAYPKWVQDPTDASKKIRRWKRTPSSTPKYIQLSSRRTLSISDVKGNKLSIKMESAKGDRQERIHYFVGIYSKKQRDFEVPYTLEKDGKRMKYIQLDLNEVNAFQQMLDGSDYDVILNGDDRTAFSLDKYRLKFFEFQTYDNDVDLQAEVNKPSFDPFESPYFKLIFTM